MPIRKSKKQPPLNMDQYDGNAFWGDLQEIWDMASKLGQVGVMLNVALLRARFTGLYSPLEELSKAKITRGENGVVDVRILDFKEVPQEGKQDAEPNP